MVIIVWSTRQSGKTSQNKRADKSEANGLHNLRENIKPRQALQNYTDQPNSALVFPLGKLEILFLKSAKINEETE